VESKEKVISEMNHHIESIKRELDAAYASIRYFQERDEEYQEEVSMLKYRELEGLERERGYRAQLEDNRTHLYELIKEITRKLGKYSRQLHENPGDPTISEKISKYRRKVMRLAGINDNELVEQMENMSI